MAQAPTFIEFWDVTRPFGTDLRTESDDYHRNFSKTVQDSFPAIGGAVTATHQDLNTIAGLNAAGTKPLPGVGGQTVVYFYLATPPPKYTPANPDGNVRNLTIGGTFGTGGGDNPISQPVNTTVTVSVTLPATTGDYTLTEADIPAHDHGSAGNHQHGISTGNADTPPFNLLAGADVFSETEFTNAAGAHTHTSFGGGGPHSHTISSPSVGSGTGTDTLTPRYAMGVLGKLDA